ncbi:hypothetical protein GCM10027262_34080 [Nocardia tengchongensis]
MTETAASVGPYRLCSPAEVISRKPAPVSGGSASPITKTYFSEAHWARVACATKTVSIDGTKSVTVTPWRSIISATYSGSRWPSGVATSSFAPTSSGMK